MTDLQGLTPNSPTPQAVRVVLTLDGESVTLTATVGATVTTISGTISTAQLGSMGTRAGVLNWSGDGTAMRLDGIDISLPTVQPQILTVWNASRPGSNLDYQADRPAMLPTPMDGIIFHSGHNSVFAPPQYVANFKTQADRILANHPGAVAAVTSQNPKYPPVDAAAIVQHRARQAELPALAAREGWQYIHAYGAFLAATGSLTTDGTHPNAAGSELWATVVYDALTRE